MIVDGKEVDIEGATIPLTDKGEYKNLHTEIYKAFKRGECPKLKDTLDTMELIKQLCSQELNAQNV
jgi:hypothetical protein